jgi:hypothetical protein
LEGQEQVGRTILEQTEVLCKDWAAMPGPTPQVQHMSPWVYDGERVAAPL